MANYPNSPYMQQMTPQQSQQMSHQMYNNAPMQQEMQMQQMLMGVSSQQQLSAQQQMMMNPTNRPMQMQALTPEQQMMIRQRQESQQRMMNMANARQPIPRNRYQSQITPQQHSQVMAKMTQQYNASKQQQASQQQQQSQQSQAPPQGQQPQQQQQQQQMYYQPQRIMNSSTMRAPMAVHGGHVRQEGISQHQGMVSISSDMNIQYVTTAPQMAGAVAQGIPVNYNTVRQVPFNQGPGGPQQKMNNARQIVYQVNNGPIPRGVRAEVQNVPANSVIYGGTTAAGETVVQMVPGPSTAPARPQNRAPTTLMMALSSQPQPQTVPIEAVPVSSVSVPESNVPTTSVQSPVKKISPPPPASTEKPSTSRSTSKKSNSKNSKAKANAAPPAPRNQPESAPLPARTTTLVDRSEIDRVVKELGLDIDEIPFKLLTQYAETYSKVVTDDLAALVNTRKAPPEVRQIMKEGDARYVIKKLKGRYAHI